MTSEELVREFSHRVLRRPGAVAPLHRLDVAGNKLACLAPCRGDCHFIGVASPGIASAPVHRAGKGEAPDAGGLDRQVSPEITSSPISYFLARGSAARMRRTNVDFGLSVMDRGSMFGPRG